MGRTIKSRVMRFLPLALVLLLAGSCVPAPPSSDRLVSAVVRIDTVVTSWSEGRSMMTRGTGAGVIVSSDGKVVTNYHVVAGALRVKATLYDGTELDASVLGLDPWTDLAVVQLEPSRAPYDYLKLGRSADLRPGDPVHAVGSPQLMRHSVSRGIVSSTRRFLASEMFFPDGMKTGTFTAWLQVDALVEPGSSGGPVANSKGEVIGIIARGSTGSFGFCIPSDQVNRVMRDLLQFGTVKRGWLGLLFAPGRSYCEAAGIAEEVSGPVVSEIEADSPLAGTIKPGDILLSMNGTPVIGRYEEDLPSVREKVAGTLPGTQVRLSFLRPGAGGTVDATVTLGEQVPAAGPNAECKAWGLTVRGITRETVKDYALPDAHGVLVTGVRDGGPASVSGIQAGFVIHSVDGKAIDTFEQFITLFHSAKEGAPVLLTTTAGKFSLMHLVEPENSSEVSK